ncbi:hypothetical protein COCNU_11G006720 [Cocos nucifera]|uniref:Calponin-homology (CH) domain-containing protein n=1 Tax=Cocos nucifera TaxID=13894 RepID=A0A8K0NA16_COCNU|nr:hypothetical protein COCNU_11G006720 [Cocos nucifera]
MGFTENKEIAEKNGILMANEGKKLEKGEDGDDVEEGEGEEVLNRKMSEASLYATEDDDEEEDGKGAKGIDLGPKVSLKDQLEKDKDDESLRRWKEQLLGSVDLISVGENLEPEVMILSLSIQSPGRPDIVLPLPMVTNSKGVWFTLKEGSSYKLKFSFSVSNNIVSGLRYTNRVWKTGVKVDSTKEMLGTFSPQLEPYTCEVYLNLQARAAGKLGNAKNSSSFLKATTTTLLHTINESEKASYVAHINSYLGEDPFLKKCLPLDPASNDLFNLVRDGVLLCKLINVAVPGTIDERAINRKRVLNPWERNENHTLCLNSAKAIGCTVVNIGTQDLVEGRPHLVLGLISQIIKIQLLADLNLKKTPQLVELVDDSKDVEELMSLAPEKMLLKWMNFHLKKAGYKKTVTNFSSDVKTIYDMTFCSPSLSFYGCKLHAMWDMDGEAYAYLLNALAPEHCSTATLDTKDPHERAKMVLDQAEKLDCKRYLSPKDITEGSPNLNLAFVAQIFQHRQELAFPFPPYTLCLVKDYIDCL